MATQALATLKYATICAISKYVAEVRQLPSNHINYLLENTIKNDDLRQIYVEFYAMTNRGGTSLAEGMAKDDELGMFTTAFQSDATTTLLKVRDKIPTDLRCEME
jgi:hypothetical protein